MGITGVILAGGMARRMGGAEKGLIPFQGRPLVAHILERIHPQVDEILINANRETDTYGQFGHPVISDLIPDFAGPLAGLHCGMTHAGHPLVVTVPCDSPFLPADLVSRLLAALEHDDADLALARTGSQPHPVFCLCRTSLLPDLTRFLQEGGRKFSLWIANQHSVEVAFDDETDAFANINTMNELACLEK